MPLEDKDSVPPAPKCTKRHRTATPNPQPVCKDSANGGDKEAETVTTAADSIFDDMMVDSIGVHDYTPKCIPHEISINRQPRIPRGYQQHWHQ